MRSKQGFIDQACFLIFMLKKLKLSPWVDDKTFFEWEDKYVAISFCNRQYEHKLIKWNAVREDIHVVWDSIGSLK